MRLRTPLEDPTGCKSFYLAAALELALPSVRSKVKLLKRLLIPFLGFLPGIYCLCTFQLLPAKSNIYGYCRCRQLDTPTFKELLLEQRKSWRQAMERRDRLEALLRIQRKPYKKTVDQLCVIQEVKKLEALKILSEIGTDLSSFRSSEAFCS